MGGAFGMRSCLLSALTFSVWLGGSGAEDEEDLLSCVGRCEEAYFPGLPCYCNEACAQYENCCFDYFAECFADYTTASEDWTDYDGHSYRYFEDVTINAIEARAACREEGGLLVSINDVEEQDFVSTRVLGKRPLSVFIGGSDEQTEARWLWSDGTVMPLPKDDTTWNAWGDGQPDDMDGEDCSILTSYTFWTDRKLTLDNYIWRDYTCNFNPTNEIQGYLCERTLACFPNPCQNNATCQYDGARNPEFKCQCAENFRGTLCQYEVFPGADWTYCGDTELTSSAGVITSPLYPETYPSLVNCQWHLMSADGNTITLRVNDMVIEESKGCTFDHLAMYDGSNSSALPLVAPTCGNISDSIELQLPVTSSGRNVMVEFLTDTSAEFRGFSIYYEHDTCGQGEGDSGCGTRRLFKARCGEIKIIQGPGSGRCEWRLEQEENSIIQLSFEFFHIEETGSNCERGGLTIHEGHNATACGQRFPWLYYSDSNDLTFSLEGVNWLDGIHGITIKYTTIDSNEMQINSEQTKVSEQSGTLSSESLPANILTGDSAIYKWLITVKVGDKLHLDVDLQGPGNASLVVYGGHSELSDVVLDMKSTDPSSQTSLTLNTFQSMIVFTKPLVKDISDVIVTYNNLDWIPIASGCYSPFYYDNTSSHTTENSFIVDLAPVVVMLSDDAYDATNPGYEAGLYCKWRLRTTPGSRINFDFLDADIQPLQSDCGYDGFVIYDGGSLSSPMHGPYCGSKNIMDLSFTSSSDHALVVFYSDTALARRKGGKLRVVTSRAHTPCPHLGMPLESNSDSIDVTCGVILSPGFPGLVPPGLWTWVIKGPDKASFTLYPYYIKGPGLSRNCFQYFQILELSHDSQTLKMYESYLLKLCEDTTLFVLETAIQVPPHDQVSIELNTMKSPFESTWEFKIGYNISMMSPPLALENDTTSCPEEYLGYKGSCYRYYAWVYRHYKSEEYEFQTTWSEASAQCQKEGGQLISVNNPEELYFIQYTLSDPDKWFWDSAAPFQLNHRLVYLGLDSRQGNFKWADGSQLAYSDWNRPTEIWEKPAVHSDTQILDILHLDSRQPVADSASLCSGMLFSSPFGSSRWVRIPCDYPMFRAGIICEKSPLLLQGQCPQGYYQIQDHCYGLHLVTAGTQQDACNGGKLAVLEGDNSQVVKHFELLIQDEFATALYETGDGMCHSVQYFYENGEMVISPSLPCDKSKNITHLICSIAKEPNTLVRIPGPTEKVCTGSITINQRCLHLVSNLPHMADDFDASQAEAIQNYTSADDLCAKQDFQVARLTNTEFDDFTAYLKLWKHGLDHGGIWLAKDDVDCRMIKVYKTYFLDVETLYSLNTVDCFDQYEAGIKNVLCETSPIVRHQQCQQHQFTCGNAMCVSLDATCNGFNDCLDGSDERDCDCGPSMFSCANGRCVPISLYCDQHDDCGDESDEDLCFVEECAANQFQCQSQKQCISEESTCDFMLDCVDGSDEDPMLCATHCRGFQCYSGLCLPDRLRWDAMTDCPGLAFEDEEFETDLLIIDIKALQDRLDKKTNKTSFIGCSEGPGYIPCEAGYRPCYPTALSCVYDTAIPDEAGAYPIQSPCRAGNHLAMNCEKVECPGMYHCPMSHCIPYHKICDGKSDCPGGQDEEKCGAEYSCEGMFRCKESSVCLLQEEVCNGVKNCPLNEDEKYCGQIDPLCTQCSCQAYVSSCANLTGIVDIANYESGATRTLRAVLLSNTRVVLHSESFLKLHWLARLSLRSSGLQGQLPGGIFNDLTNLLELDLSRNQLVSFQADLFIGLVSIQRLDISQNLISSLNREVMVTLMSLRIFNMSGNPRLEKVDLETFDDNSYMTELHTDAYKFCCVASQVELCTPEADEFSSCEDLMANYPLQISIWVLGVCAFVGNLFVIVWRVKTDRKKVPSFFIINLGCSDFLMGVYLLIIASVDVYYRGNYILNADAWRSSFLCQLAGVLAMLSSEVSVFILTIMTLDRALAIIYPLKMVNFRLRHARIIVAAVWLIGLFLSILPTFGIPYFGVAFFGRTGVCLPFQISNDKVAGWEYSVFIFLILNLVSFIIIFIGYVSIFLRIKSSWKDMQHAKSTDNNEYELAKKLVLIVATDFVCWVPIILIGFAALAGAKISPAISAWIAVFILPLNAAMNPLLYTVSALDCSGKKKKRKPVNSSSSINTVMTTICAEKQNGNDAKM